MMDTNTAPAQPAQLRQQLMEEWVKPAVQACFDRYPELGSAILMVAQYWDDEALDAVHNFFVFSVLKTPDLQAAFWAEENDPDVDPVNLPGLPAPWELLEIVWQRDWQQSEQLCWDDNGIAIPAFAAYCREDAHQAMSISEAYAPYAVIRRGKQNQLEVEIIGKMQRPWLEEEVLDQSTQGEDWPEIFLRQNNWVNRLLESETAYVAR